MLEPLAGKVALVTGATRRAGIGAAIAEEWAAAGANVGIGYFRPYDRGMPWGVRDAEPDEIVAGLRRHGVQAEGFEVDLSRPEGPVELMRQVRAQLGPVDILVNNAAYSTNGGIDDLTAEDLDRHYAVNVRGTALLCAEFVRQHLAGQSGRIVNLTSGQGASPMPAELAYATRKGAADALTLSLSAATAALGITVNAVDPGPTDTGWMTGDVRERLLAAAPQGRLSTPSEVAEVVAFLVSDEASKVTGQIVRVRGRLS